MNLTPAQYMQMKPAPVKVVNPHLLLKTPREVRNRESVSSTPKSRLGWAVQIIRRNGTTFLASGGKGDAPPVWSTCNRSYALSFRDDLAAHGQKARLVRVRFYDPEVLP